MLISSANVGLPQKTSGIFLSNPANANGGTANNYSSHVTSFNNSVAQEPSSLLKNIKDSSKVGGTASKLQKMPSSKELNTQLNTGYANVSKSVEKPASGNKLQSS